MGTILLFFDEEDADHSDGDGLGESFSSCLLDRFNRVPCGFSDLPNLLLGWILWDHLRFVRLTLDRNALQLN